MRPVIDWKYTAAVTGLTLVGAWAAGTPESRPAAQPTTQVPTRTVPPVSEIESEALKLQARVRGTMATRTLPHGRNPFRFGAPGVAPIARRRDAVVEAEMGGGTPPTAPEPVMRLIGMASDVSAANASQTAIITGPSGVVLVQVGDTIDDRYRVTAVEADAVELTEPNGARRRLSLTP